MIKFKGISVSSAKHYDQDGRNQTSMSVRLTKEDQALAPVPAFKDDFFELRANHAEQGLLVQGELPLLGNSLQRITVPIQTKHALLLLNKILENRTLNAQALLATLKKEKGIENKVYLNALTKTYPNVTLENVNGAHYYQDFHHVMQIFEQFIEKDPPAS